MREHQIVITLKPDQFLEVQRLSRAANAKSMGIFVRQQLLAALGIEGAATGKQASSVPPAGANANEQVLTQLKRLHSELKMFVAESLSIYPIEAAHQAASVSGVEIAEQRANAAAADPLEKLAEKTFAISPRLGAIGQPDADPPAADRAGRQRESSVRPDPSAHQVPVSIEDPLDKLLPKEDQLKGIDPSFSSSGHPRRRATDLANESTAPPNVSQPPTADYEIPLSIAERRRLLEAQQQAQAEATSAATAMPEQAFSAPAPSPVQELAEEEEAEEPAAPAPPVPAQSTPPAGSPAVPNETQKHLGYPSLSGSPPPKRRQV